MNNPFWWCDECRGVGWVVTDYQRNTADRCQNCNRSDYDPQVARINRSIGKRADG